MNCHPVLVRVHRRRVGRVARSVLLIQLVAPVGEERKRDQQARDDGPHHRCRGARLRKILQVGARHVEGRHHHCAKVERNGLRRGRRIPNKVRAHPPSWRLARLLQKLPRAAAEVAVASNGGGVVGRNEGGRAFILRFEGRPRGIPKGADEDGRAVRRVSPQLAALRICRFRGARRQALGGNDPPAIRQGQIATFRVPRERDTEALDTRHNPPIREEPAILGS
eukprot:scaffold3327_cov242-Pinguiococcus_pyrenoidosus.AAC.4